METPKKFAETQIASEILFAGWLKEAVWWFWYLWLSNSILTSFVSDGLDPHGVVGQSVGGTLGRIKKAKKKQKKYPKIKKNIKIV